MKRIAVPWIVLALFTLAPPAGAGPQSAPQDPGPETIVFPSQRGTVTLTHAKHAQLAECAVCHHESRPEMPLESPHQACRACHTEPPIPPVITGIRQAMHDTANRVGVCYSCHMEEAAAGNAVPTKCSECHVR